MEKPKAKASKSPKASKTKASEKDGGSVVEGKTSESVDDGDQAEGDYKPASKPKAKASKKTETKVKAEVEADVNADVDDNKK